MKDGSYKRCGCMYEIFEDCILDIDLAIEKSKELGYRRFILMGHSYGCNKLIYYYYKKHPNILGLVLASAPDMVGLQLLRQSDYKELINEAKNNIDKGKATKILSNLVEDYMYMSSQTYYNWLKKDSNLDNLPVMANSKDKAKNCNNFKYKIINETNHFYVGKEKEVSSLIFEWINDFR